jgi:WD40 repeat protein
MNAGTSNRFKYWAFLSYSHQDNIETRRDGTTGHVRWAEWLHDSLETYRVPSEFRTRQTRTGEPMPERFFPVFQDEKELPINADLGESIRIGLEQSRFLIVICSPRSATSQYVNEEVRYFKELGRQDRIMALMIDGEPNASFGNKAGFSQEEECFCEALRHPLNANHEIDRTRRDAQEPIAGDVRIKDSISTREAKRRDLSNHRSVLEYMKLKLLAGLMGVGFDELVHRDKERQLREERAKARRLRRLAAAFGILALLTTVAGLIAYKEKNIAQANYQTARQRLAQVYLERANAAYDSRDIAEQALFLSQALASDATSVSAEVVEDLANRTAGVIWSDTLRSPLNALAISPDRRVIFVGADSGDVYELETKTGVEIRRLHTNGGAVSAIAITPDGCQIATGSADNVVRVWRLDNGQLARELKQHTRLVTSVRFSPDGRTLYSTSDDRTAIAWDLNTFTIRFRLTGHGAGVDTIACSSDGRLLATGSDDHTIRLWAASDGHLISVLSGHEEDVTRVAFSSNNKKLLSSSGDGTIRVWDIESKQNVWTLRASEASITAFALSADSKKMFSAGADESVRIWDTATGEERCRLRGYNGWIEDVLPVFGDFVVSCGREGRVCLWALPKEADATDLGRSQYVVRRVAFGADEHEAFTGGDDTMIRHWSLPDGKLVAEWKGHDGPITAVVPFNHGRSLLTASHDETVKVWDVPTQTETAKMSGHTSLIWSAVVSPNELHAASGGADQKIIIWNLSTHVPARILNGHAAVVNCVAFSPDSRFLLSGANDRTVILWDVNSGRLVRQYTGFAGQVSSVAFSPDGQSFLCSAWGDDVQLWNVSSDQPLRRLVGGKLGCDAVAYSPDGKLAIAGGLDGTLRIWNVSSGRELRRIPAHVGRIYGLSVARNGRHLLTCGLNGRARFWTIPLGALAREQVSQPIGVDALVETVQSRTGLMLVNAQVSIPDKQVTSVSGTRSPGAHPRLQELFDHLAKHDAIK